MTDEPRGPSDAAEKWDKIVEILNETQQDQSKEIEFDAAMDAKLDDMEARAGRAKRSSAVTGVQTEGLFKGNDREDYRGMGVGMSAAYAIIGLPIAGWLVGLALANFGGMPEAMTACVGTGVVAGFAMALLILKRHS